MNIYGQEPQDVFEKYEGQYERALKELSAADPKLYIEISKKNYTKPLRYFIGPEIYDLYTVLLNEADKQEEEMNIGSYLHLDNEGNIIQAECNTPAFCIALIKFIIDQKTKPTAEKKPDGNQPKPE